MKPGHRPGFSMLDSNHFKIELRNGVYVLQLRSVDETNRLSRSCVRDLNIAIDELATDPKPLVITGNQKFFSAGADINEIKLLGVDALEFARMGQRLMNSIDQFPSRVWAAVSGYCMGGGLDLALACDIRIAHPDATFGHRGASLGLITGWGGTQRLPRLIGRSRALQMFVAAEKVNAATALEIGLVNAIAEDPFAAAQDLLRR